MPLIATQPYHVVVIVGYDIRNGEQNFIYYDSAEASKKLFVDSFIEFERESAIVFIREGEDL